MDWPSSLHAQDIDAILTLFGDVCGMTTPLVDRRQSLLDGLLELVNADAWVWAIRRGDAASETLVPLWIVDRGLKDDAERAWIHKLVVSPGVSSALKSLAEPMRPSTLIFDLGTPADPFSRAMQGVENPTELRHLMIALYPLQTDLTSAIGLHRRRNKPAYTERERQIAHLVVSHVNWLHRAGLDMPAATEPVEGLSPRLIETLMHVLAGDSRKQIATKMNISEYTVADHLKRLHRQFRVKSRGELLA
ncbi:MAG: helix-turn-helix transcriptional regulator, partial [Tepidisphaeraceae bacterium]